MARETIGLKLIVIAEAGGYVVVRNTEYDDYYMLGHKSDFTSTTSVGVGDCGSGQTLLKIIKHYVDYYDRRGDNSRHLVTAQENYAEADAYSSLAMQLEAYFKE